MRVDLLHAGRVVHRSEWGEERRCWCADDWDNCADPDFATWQALLPGG